MIKHCYCQDVTGVSQSEKREDYEMKELFAVYPFSLAFHIFENKERALGIYIPNLSVVLELLSEKEAGVLQKRFRDKMTLQAIGEVYGVGRERIRQIEAKALRKLRHPVYANMLLAVPLTEMKKEKEAYRSLNKKYEELLVALESEAAKQIDLKELVQAISVPIEDLDLSVRSYNCLRRAGKITLDDIAKMSRQELMRIRNLGRACGAEIEHVLRNRGIRMRED